MKLNKRDWIERERRLMTADATPIRPDRTLQVITLVTAVFGVVVLAWVALYLFDLSWTPEEINWQLKGSRFLPGE